MTPDLPDETLLLLSSSQILATREWAADDRLWTTQETVAFNLQTFARAILAEERRLSAEKDARLKSAQETMEAYRLRALVADEDKRLETVDCANVLKLWMDANARLVEQLAEKDATLASLTARLRIAGAANREYLDTLAEQSATIARLEQENEALRSVLTEKSTAEMRRVPAQLEATILAMREEFRPLLLDLGGIVNDEHDDHGLDDNDTETLQRIFTSLSHHFGWSEAEWPTETEAPESVKRYLGKYQPAADREQEIDALKAERADLAKRNEILKLNMSTDRRRGAEELQIMRDREEQHESDLASAQQRIARLVEALTRELIYPVALVGTDVWAKKCSKCGGRWPEASPANHADTCVLNEALAEGKETT